MIFIYQFLFFVFLIWFILFQAEGQSSSSFIFGEAIGFYQLVNHEKTTLNLFAYQRFEEVECKLCTIRGTLLQGSIQILPVEKIRGLVGIWKSNQSNWIYILRKHPGFDVLNPEQLGISASELEDQSNEDL